MIPPLMPITESATTRAERYDLHSCRCLVENCSRTQAVQMAYVFDRNNAATGNLLDSLEWGWRMKRGTLNLDTRHNIFFLGASLHKLYKEMKWALVPEEEIMYQYFDEERLRALKRREFPQIESRTFRYKLLPVQDMEDIHITRQSNEPNSKCVDVHHFPFDDFPIITSHIHPKYVILHLGKILRGIADSTHRVLIKKHPWLNDVDEICMKWRAKLPGGFSEDSTYMGTKSESNKPTTLPVSSDDNVSTPPRRIQLVGGQTFDQPIDYAVLFRSSSSDASSSYQHKADSTAHVYKSSKKRRNDDLDNSQPSDKRRMLTSTALRRQEKNDDLKSVKWTIDRMASWAKGSRAPVPPPTPPPPPAPLHHLQPPPSPPAICPSRPKSPLRRSARLKAKLNRT